MEKIEADIFNIIHNTKIRLQGDAEDNYGFMGKGYAEKLAIEIAKEIQPSEPLKELDEDELAMEISTALRAYNVTEGSISLRPLKKGSVPIYEYIAKAIFSALPAQREVRYPEKLDCKCKFVCHCGNWCALPKGEVWNSCIDEMKKLNS